MRKLVESPFSLHTMFDRNGVPFTWQYVERWFADEIASCLCISKVQWRSCVAVRKKNSSHRCHNGHWKFCSELWCLTKIMPTNRRPSSAMASLASSQLLQPPKETAASKSDGNEESGETEKKSWFKQSMIGRTPSLPSHLGKKKHSFFKVNGTTLLLLLKDITGNIPEISEKIPRVNEVISRFSFYVLRTR